MSKVQSSVGPRALRLVPLLLRWFAANARDLPWRRTRDPYAIWISEVMLQQTQVRTVVPYFERWMRELPDISSLAAAREQRVLKLWEGLGYYRRARNLRRAAREILRVHDGQFPRDFDAMLALPGVGRYTAGAIASIAFDVPHPILDGNVTRVLARLFAIRQSPRANPVQKRMWSLAGHLVEAAGGSARRVRLDGVGGRCRAVNRCSALNQSLMELGALVCTPRAPRCDECPVKLCCDARRLGLVELLPVVAKRPQTAARQAIAVAAVRGERVLVRKRPQGGQNGGLWEFPNVEARPGEKGIQEALRTFQPELRGGALSAICTVRHSITRHRITVHAFLAKADRIRPQAGEVWVGRARLAGLPFASAHARIRDALLSRFDAR